MRRGRTRGSETIRREMRWAIRIERGSPERLIILRLYEDEWSPEDCYKRVRENFEIFTP